LSFNITSPHAKQVHKE